MEGDARDASKEREEALQEEIPRSLTSVSTVKRRFDPTLYSKKMRGQKNELRLKALTCQS
jgi:hypothetical protein